MRAGKLLKICGEAQDNDCEKGTFFGPSDPRSQGSYLPSSAGCKLSSWSSPSVCAREFVAEKLLAAFGYGRSPTSKWVPGTVWKRVRSRWIRSLRSVFRISLQSWRESRVSWVSSICLKSRSTVKVRISIWFGSTTCLLAPSAQVSTGLPEEVFKLKIALLLILTAGGRSWFDDLCLSYTRSRR